MATKRKDKSRVVLKTGEVQRKDGTYQFSWQDSQMKRRFVYARTLDDLREKEKRIQKDKCDGIKTEARYTTIDELFDLWANMKRGLKNNTFENYKYMYNTFVRPVIGSKRISTLKKSDIKKYYNYLVDERNLKPSTIDNIHTVLHQVLQIAVDDDFIRNNPSDNVLRELKKAHCFQSEKRRALTKPEQELFLNFLKTHPVYEHWYPVFAVMIGTGLRVGEVTGLRWCDIDMESGMIDVNHMTDIQILFSSIVLVRHSTKPHSTKQSEELSVIAMMSSFCTVMNLMCYFLILAATRLDIHLQQECVKLE
mgnify:CR=1 FL=1